MVGHERLRTSRVLRDGEAASRCPPAGRRAAQGRGSVSLQSRLPQLSHEELPGQAYCHRYVPNIVVTKKMLTAVDIFHKVHDTMAVNFVSYFINNTFNRPIRGSG